MVVTIVRNGNQEEQHGQNGAHRLAFFSLALRLLIDNIIVLGRYHDSSAEHVLYASSKSFFPISEIRLICA